MNDVVIKTSVMKRELAFLGSMFVVAFLMNVYAIVVHEGLWSELVSQLHIVVLLTLFLYFFISLVRLLIWGGAAMWNLARKKVK
jgi:hypothetical protein